MTRVHALVAVPVLLTAVLGLAGCRGAERAALPAPAASSPAPASGPGRASGSVASTGPLADVEATVDAIEHDVDSDSGSDAGR
jgi:hypothetical protein